MRAYWANRTPQLGMCRVIEINYEDKKCCISNGAVRVFPDLEDLIIMHKSGEKDSNNIEIYDLDMVEVDYYGEIIKGIVRFGQTKFYIDSFSNYTLFEIIRQFKVTIIGNELENK